MNNQYPYPPSLREDETTMEDRSSRRVRALVTRKAQRGLSASEIVCALLSMTARSTCPNQRPNTLTQDRISQRRPKPLAPHGRTIHWGHSRYFWRVRRMSANLLTAAEWRTSPNRWLGPKAEVRDFSITSPVHRGKATHGDRAVGWLRTSRPEIVMPHCMWVCGKLPVQAGLAS
jgi:hypothetical protein